MNNQPQEYEGYECHCTNISWDSVRGRYIGCEEEYCDEDDDSADTCDDFEELF